MKLSRNDLARLSVCYHFLLEGFFTGTWASQLYSLRDNEDISDSLLGFCVLFSYLGSVVVSPFSGYLVLLLGSKRTTILGAFLYVFSLGVMSFATGVPLLCLSFFSFGFTMGIMDVAMNSAGVLVETVAGYPIMGSFHGCYSISAAVGSLIGGLLTTAGWGTADIFLFLCAVGTATNLICGQGLYNREDEHRIEKKDDYSGKEREIDAAIGSVTATPTFMIPRGPALYVCIVGFLGSFGEGSMVTWLIIYFKDILNESSLNATIGFSMFMVFMGLGRFSCDKIREYIGRQRLVRYEGMVVLIGFLLLILAAFIGSSMLSLVTACFGSIFAGAGISTIIPTVFSTAGRLPGQHAGSAIATAAAISYAGSIISPILVGVLSDAMGSLKWALLLDGLLLSLMIPLSYGIPPELGKYQQPLLAGSEGYSEQGGEIDDEYDCILA